MRAALTSYLAGFDRFARRTPFTPVYGLARTLLAVGTLLTLCFSPPSVLFDGALFHTTNLPTALDPINIFYLVGYQHLAWGYGICLAGLGLVVSGYYPRLTGVLHWWISFSLFQAANLIEGGDQITAILTLLLVPVTLLDNRRNHWQAPAAEVSLYRNFTGRLFLVLIQLQMAVLYLQASVDKMYKLEEWKNGTAIYYFFHDPLFAYPDWLDFLFARSLTNGYVVTTLSWGTMIFELLLFGALFMAGRQRRRLLLPALAFHLGIAVIFGLVSFFFAMAGGLVLFLLPVHTPLKGIKKRKALVEPSSAWQNDAVPAPVAHPAAA